MALFKILRGPSSGLAQMPLKDGYCYFTPDTGLFHVDYEVAPGDIRRIPISASTLNGAVVAQTLRDEELEIPSSALLYALNESINNRISEIQSEVDISVKYAIMTSEEFKNLENKREDTLYFVTDDNIIEDMTHHVENDDIHVTLAEKADWNAAKIFAEGEHAPTNAEKNQNAFTYVTVGSTTVAADNPTGTLNIVAGDNVNITASDRSDTITINVPDMQFTLEEATVDTLGGVKIGYTENGRNYPVELDNSQMFVNVPWTDTNKIEDILVKKSVSWNNDKTGKNQIYVRGCALWKVSDLTPSAESLIGQTVTMSNDYQYVGGATSYTITEDVINDIENGVFAIENPATVGNDAYPYHIAVVTKSTANYPIKGIYFMYEQFNDYYTTNLTLSTGIGNDGLPIHHGGTGATDAEQARLNLNAAAIDHRHDLNEILAQKITWNGDTTGLEASGDFYKVSDEYIDFSILKGAYVTISARHQELGISDDYTVLLDNPQEGVIISEIPDFPNSRSVYFWDSLYVKSYLGEDEHDTNGTYFLKRPMPEPYAGGYEYISEVYVPRTIASMTPKELVYGYHVGWTFTDEEGNVIDGDESKLYINLKSEGGLYRYDAEAYEYIAISSKVEDVTTTTSGLMSAADKIKLDSLEDDVFEGYLNNNQFTDKDGKVITGALGKLYVNLNADGGLYRFDGSNYIAISKKIENATTTAAGLMSAADKIKLDGVEDNANNYIHPTSGVKSGIYRSVTVDDKGHVTAGTNPTTLEGYGITDAEPKGAVATHNVSTEAHADIRQAAKDAKDRADAAHELAEGKADKVHNHDDRYYTESEIDAKISPINTLIDNIKDGSIVVGKATTADSAIKATQDSAGNTITTTYETKANVDTKISNHNTDANAHPAIRELIKTLSDKVNNFLDVDDTTKDQLSEILDLINDNKGDLESLLSGKVNITDIVNNLSGTESNKPLAATQGAVLKGLIDNLQNVVNTKASQEALENHINDRNADKVTTGNPHGISKETIGLNNVDNTADANKPVSGPQAQAIKDAEDRAGVNLSNHNSNAEAHPAIRSAVSAAQDKADEAYTLADGKANKVHSHVSTDITDLSTLLEGKANKVHIHDISDVQNLESALGNYATKDDILEYVILTEAEFEALEEKDPSTLYIVSDVADDGSGVQSDWSVNDPEDPAYVKNRPFYTGDPVETVFVEETIISEWDDYNSHLNTANTTGFAPALGQEYRVTWNDTEYTCIAYFGSWGRVAIGNDTLADGSNDTGEPFYIDAEWIEATVNDDRSHTFKIEATVYPVTKIEKKYIPDDAFIGAYGTGVNSEIFNSYTTNIASGDYSHAEGYETQAIGDLSHAEGYNTCAKGDYSHAEGGSTHGRVGSWAYGGGTHAEGLSTVAWDWGAHSEGCETIALYQNSHAEGRSTFASGYAAHAEGGGRCDWYTVTGEANGTSYVVNTSGTPEVGDFVVCGYRSAEITGYDAQTKILTTSQTLADHNLDKDWIHIYSKNAGATGDYSHAEGKETLAAGYAAHSEGFYTKAVDISSHAEGYKTIASGKYQHVQGKYNIEDTTSAHIVGNGKSSKQSNAHTLDWDGNAWFAGDIYVGSTSGTNKDEGSRKVALVPLTRTVTLAPENWTAAANGKFTQSIEVQGISADEFAQRIDIMPTIASQEAYIENVVYASAQVENGLTFTAKVQPTTNLNVFIIIQELS